MRQQAGCSIQGIEQPVAFHLAVGASQTSEQHFCSVIFARHGLKWDQLVSY